MNIKGMVKRHFVCVPLTSVLNVDKSNYKDRAAIILEAKPTKREAQAAANVRRKNAGPDSIHQFCFVKTLLMEKARMIPRYFLGR